MTHEEREYLAACMRLAVITMAVASNTLLSGGSMMVFPGREWRGTTPEAEGVDATRLEAAVKFLEENVGQDDIQRLVIVRHGCIIWKGPDFDHRHGVWSVAKSFTSAVLGLLTDDGKATAESPVGRASYSLFRS